MNLEFSTIDGLRIRYAAARNPGKRIYCAAANAIGYRLSRPTAAAKAGYLARVLTLIDEVQTTNKEVIQ